MQRAVRGRRATGPVSPTASPRMGVYSYEQADGTQIVYARGSLGGIVGLEFVEAGQDRAPAVYRMGTLIYGDDIESWSRPFSVVSGHAPPPVLSSDAPPQLAVCPDGPRVRTSRAAGGTSHLMLVVRA